MLAARCVRHRSRVRKTQSQEAPVTRAQTVALILLGVLFLIAVVILTLQVLGGSGGFDLDELPG